MNMLKSAGRFLLTVPLALALPLGAEPQHCGTCEKPRLVFGVIADVHIGGKPDAPETLEKTLRLLDKRGVDAVLCAGDIAHSGHIGEIEKFAAAWNRVFPGGRGGDGRKVELMISTGNHDVGGWGGRWNGFSEERMLAERFDYKDNFQKTWERLFGRKWELIWRREVKGYTFIGSQWSSLKPPIEEYFRDHAVGLRGSKPFFYCQHAHPKDTCHGTYGNGSWDDGASVRALSAFPNAVAFSGHSHRSLADERAVWQGAFTSIGAGCIHEGGLDYGYDNGSAFWHPSFKRNLMAPLQNPSGWGGDDEGGNFEIVEVFDSRLVVHRLSVAYGGEPIAPAWTVPLPAVAGGPFDFAVRKAKRSAPQFAADARVRIEDCPRGHRLASKARAGEPCVYVSFPAAEPIDGCRVFDYVVAAEAAGAGRVEKKIMAAGFARPGPRAGQPGECLFSAAELPKSDRIVFTVIPRDCFGLAGRPISAVALTVRPAEGDATAALQKAFDDCFLSGGGMVKAEKGLYAVKGLRLRSDTAFYLKSGARLKASRNCDDYEILAGDKVEPVPARDFAPGIHWVTPWKRKTNDHILKCASRWNNAVIRVLRARNVRIVGESGAEIDGCDSYDPVGEEHFRGVHGISVHDSTNCVFRGYTVRNTGNWAHNVWRSADLRFENLTILGGHDGVHFSVCNRVKIADCTMKVGDDCVSGFDNEDVNVDGCRFNTACSAFRFGGRRVLIENCRAWGPAEYPIRNSLPKADRISGSHGKPGAGWRKMLALFTYYSDFTIKVRSDPGEITVRNCRAENAQRFLHYNFSGNETWQKNRPLRSIRFENVEAKGLVLSLCAYGDAASKLSLSLKDCRLSFAKPQRELVRAAHVEALSMDGVCVEGVDGPCARSWGDVAVPELRDFVGAEPNVVEADEPFRVNPI